MKDTQGAYIYNPKGETVGHLNKLGVESSGKMEPIWSHAVILLLVYLNLGSCVKESLFLVANEGDGEVVPVDESDCAIQCNINNDCVGFEIGVDDCLILHETNLTYTSDRRDWLYIRSKSSQVSRLAYSAFKNSFFDLFVFYFVLCSLNPFKIETDNVYM